LNVEFRTPNFDIQPMVKNVLLAGGTGLLGRRIAALLRERGHTVRLLTRTPRGPDQFRWDPAGGEIDLAAFDGGLHAVVNLAGESIADGRWTAARRRRIVDSRVESARLLAAAFEEAGIRPAVYVSASAIGYYGDSGERRMTEGDQPVDASFMTQVCQAWEAAAGEVAALGIRTVIFRIGIVLSLEGGALPEVARPLRFGLGPYFGDGKAWWSWVHIDDLAQAFLWAIEHPEASGVFNLVAPEPVRNKPLVDAIARAMDRRVLPTPAPAFALRLALGDMSAVVLNSNLVSSDKLQQAGFGFRFRQLDAALVDLYAKAD
jgi:uncharacterized protein (TIGR01777 family)